MADALDALFEGFEREELFEAFEREEQAVTRFMKRREDEPFAVGTARVTYISEKALKVEILDGPHAGLGADGEEPCWIAKSQIHTTSEVNDTTLIDEDGLLVITKWLAGQKGWV